MDTAATVFPQKKGRLLGGVGIAGVPEIVAKIVERRAAKFVAAWFCQDLDAAESELVVLG